MKMYASMLLGLVLARPSLAQPCPDGANLVKFYIPSTSTGDRCQLDLGSGDFDLRALQRHELCVDPDEFGADAFDSQIYGFRLLEAALRLAFGDIKRVLVLGSGSGVEAITLAKKFHVTIDAVDISARAAEMTRLNAERHGVHDRVRARQGDLFDGLDATYDLILFNAPRPYLRDDFERTFPEYDFNAYSMRNGVLTKLVRPTFEEWLNSDVMRLADGAYFDTGGTLFFRTLRDFGHHLTPGGRFLWMTTSSLMDHVTSPDVVVRELSSDPWDRTDPESGYFSVFELRGR